MSGLLSIGSLPIGAAAAYAATPTETTSERVLFLSPRESDLATVTASTSVSSLPVENVQNQEPSRVWRATSSIAQYIDFRATQPFAWNAAAMAGFSLGAAGVWRLQAFAAEADIGVLAALDSYWQSVWPQGYRHSDPEWASECALLRIDNDQHYQFWRLWLSDPGAGVEALDIGRVAIGRAVQPSINCDWGGGMGFAPNGVQEPNGYGQIFTEERPTNRTMEMTWSALGQRETETTAMELSRLRGMSGDIFCFLDPGEVASFHRYSMQALFTGRHDYKAQPVWVPDSDGVSRWAWGFSMSLIQKL